MDPKVRARGGAGAVLVVLFTGAFAMGCAEMLVMGIIDLIAADLAITVPAAGVLVTAYALGVALGGPVLAFLTAPLDRRSVLLGAAALFVLLNLAPVVAPDYRLFVATRVCVGAVQGLFIAAALTAATSVVPPDRAGRAMGTVISGFAAASALGLPMGALVGQHLGWQASLLAIVGVGVVVLLAARLSLPSIPAAGTRGAGEQLRHALAPRVLAVLALCCLVFAGVQSALTYLVPYLGDTAGVSGPAVAFFLLAFGIATTLGSAAGGRFADVHAVRALVVGTVGLTVALLFMYVFGAHAPVAFLAVVGVGLFAMGLAPAMQTRVMGLAGPGAALAAALPASAASAGDAVGALLGGVAIARSGLAAAVLTGAVIAAAAVGVSVATRHLRPPQVTEKSESPSPDTIDA
ncbi:MFS transporter [Jiangella endophytica]|uniref:MFS transporter n=1 Tax=Jiangella endophytica TaxID=1623398 RepID=UPI000E343532|nr:MFS transporter [Jiangella endophytica]